MLSIFRASESGPPCSRARHGITKARFGVAAASLALGILGHTTAEAAQPPLEVVRHGESAYQIVPSASAAREESRAAALLRDYLQACGVGVKLVTDKEDNPVSDREIVVGATRRESPALFEFDRHSVGKEGFLVKAAGQRIFILGGSPAGTRQGVEFFLREFCGYAGDPKTGVPLATLSVPADYEHRQRQQYAIGRVTVGGRGLDAFTIASNEANLPAAETLRDQIYDHVGIWLKIAPPPAAGPAIEFSSRNPARAGGFEMEVANGNLVLRTDLPHGFQRGILGFFANEVRGVKGDLEMDEGFRHNQSFAGVVRYREFGALGDGKTDDIEAIVAAHAFANQHGLPVQADEGATYYIGGKDRTAVIQTDTDFGTAAFIIDDTAVENRGNNIFLVRSNLQSFKLEGITTLRRNQEKLEVSLPATCMVSVTDSSVKRYIRYGANRNNGSSQTDVFIVDRDGRVDMDAPIIWDFDQITSITAQPLDETTLTITGGRFTTIANAAESKYTYYGRGIAIRRSNVVVDGLEHRVTGEGDQGAPYSGFINIGSCAYVTVRNTVLTGRKTYRTIGSAGVPVSMGSYDISINRALNVSFVNCSQTNDIKDGKYWGIMGSNYCKNLTFDGCTFSRFDAHMGVANATIRNSTLGHVGINAIGSGTFTVENTTIYGRNLINLRSDYGSTWQGEFIFRDCVFIPACGRPTSATLIAGSYSGQHDFGYTCHMPERIVIENLRIDDSNHPENYQGAAIFSNFNPRRTDESHVEKYPYVITREVVLKNVTTASGKPLRRSDNPFMFKDVKITTVNND